MNEGDPSLEVAKRVFKSSIQYLNQGGSRRVTDEEKLLLYAYYKQATLGDDQSFPSKPKPGLEESAREHAIALAKWNAWNKVWDLSKLQAMLGYIRIVDCVAGGAQKWRSSVECGNDLVCGYSSGDSVDEAEEDSLTETSPAGSLNPSSIDLSSANCFGYLYKQRRVRKSWRKFFFVLEEGILYYYSSSKNHYPQGFLYLDGCEVTFDIPGSGKAQNKLFWFSIKHSKSGKSYLLGDKSFDSAKRWVKELVKSSREAASQKSVDTPSTAKHEDSLSSCENGPNMDSNIGSDANPIAREVARRFKINSLSYAFQVEGSVKKLMYLVSKSKTSWQFSFKKSGVKIFVNKDVDFPAAIGTTTIRAPARAIFNMYWDLNNRSRADPLFDHGRVVETSGPQTRVEYLRFKAVWPAVPRDFCNLVHWRILEDGKTIVSASSALDHPDCPNAEGVIRARLVVSGIVIEPRSDNSGCNVAYLVQSNPGGSIPFAISNKVQSSRPLILKRIADLLEPQYEGRLNRFSPVLPEKTKRQKHRRRTLPPRSNMEAVQDRSVFSERGVLLTSILNLPTVKHATGESMDLSYILINVTLGFLVILFIAAPDLQLDLKGPLAAVFITLVLSISCSLIWKSLKHAIDMRLETYARVMDRKP
mmetsp:Transcript_2884/g.3906  ORF Transcript_2884/g.3906 Transcript_2884/m.3906 type:complete len:645 (+) Transcript_2884:96-2030(+)